MLAFTFNLTILIAVYQSSLPPFEILKQKIRTKEMHPNEQLECWNFCVFYKYPIQLAFDNEDFDFVRELVLLPDFKYHSREQGSKGESSFIRAVQAGELDLAKFLVKHIPYNHYFTSTAFSNRNALHFAPNEEFVRWLLDIGVPYKADFAGYLPIHTAAEYGRCDVVNMFIKDVNTAFNGKKQTPLHLAVLNDQVDVVNFLLKHKADVHVKHSYNSRSPLRDAIRERKSKDIVTALLRAGHKIDEDMVRNAFTFPEDSSVLGMLLLEGAKISEEHLRSLPLFHDFEKTKDFMDLILSQGFSIDQVLRNNLTGRYRVELAVKFFFKYGIALQNIWDVYLQVLSSGISDGSSEFACCALKAIPISKMTLFDFSTSKVEYRMKYRLWETQVERLLLRKMRDSDIIKRVLSMVQYH